ncbi:[protein-PII] uridylyltransferase [Streptantibioticus ferralitis]|uniref:Bifunctional uridylyltransferase/uridylyl-removing enzyme n=1 Tax=Streptantibioticus ferralitis TaxID=236510 RepID=A0ABT5YRV0_9ACTN|nr:[protein-PII] uridylyltransferase [Streptantibioticus ferralitis]MDF2254184.1 [protein-PII] uridylyltransferase [Streptantibioticus ferralitis]
MTDRAVPETSGTPHRVPEGARSPGVGYAAARLALLNEEGQPGPSRRARLAELTDQWLAGLFPTPHAGTALVAVGGYGRGELSPRSDLDLLLLHDGSATTGEVSALADRLWYPVWDLGLALDHSVRTPAEARKTAEDDLKVQLGLLDARHIAGDPELTASLRTAVLGDWRAQAPKRLPELHELCLERAARQGELAYLLEPDLKEARGGLRDATVLRAVAASWLADAPREGLAEARTRLLDTRDALHLVTGRSTDRLSLQEQDQVADWLGVLDADTLLRQVYEAARTVAYASDVTWRAVGRVLRSRSARPRKRFLTRGRTEPVSAERMPLAEGVVEQEGEAVLARTARPERDPVLPLRAAAAAAQAGLPISLPAVRALAAAAHPLPVPWPAEAREQLVTLLGAGEATVAVWEALEAEGLITRLLPDWERVRCRPQRNPVHRWTVDRHLVETAVQASSLTRHVSRPDLLLIAALLHDIGKGWPGDHSTAGEVIARDVAARLGFGRTDADTLALLVRHHLLLIETATRRDLDDPATVESVAKAVRSTECLDLLHALTQADALATGPAAWSAWRASLVAELVRRVAGVLAGGAPPSTPTRETSAEEERLAVEAARTGGPVVALQAESEPVTEDGTEPVGVELLLAVPDRPGLLPAAAGVLALHRLTVRAADLRTADPIGAGPVTLLSWRVAAEFGSLPEVARLRADFARAFDGSLDIESRLAEREAAYPRRRGVPAPPPRVTVATGTSEVATVIEVRAQDAPGLLHRIGRALEDASGVAVRSARISTLGANAVDAFYVVGADGAPLPPDRAAEVAREVEGALR